MPDQHAAEVFRLCEEALALDEGERAAFLDGACGADSALRRDVDALLAEQFGTIAPRLDTPPWQQPTPVLAPGQRLGAYEVSERIGTGGMGTVYKARDTRLGRTVALKVIGGTGSIDPAARERAANEARTIAALSHPNICALYDVGRENGVDFLVMEHLEGQTLEERLRSRTDGGTGTPIEAEEAVRLASQMAEGLAAAHAAGIVHRDLKPANVMLVDGTPPRRGTTRAKLLDFGVAKRQTAVVSIDAVADADRRVAPVTDPSLIVGTVGYMAPEQARGEAVDARTDIFALGCVLYEMLAGERPFRGATATDVLAAVLRDEPPPMPPTLRVPPALDRIVRHCLEKHPAARFQSARDVAFALGSLVEPGGTDLPPKPAAGRRRTMTVAGLGLLAVAASIAGGLVWARGRAATEPTFRRLTFRRGWVNAARFAPDGRTVVYSAAWDGGQNEVFSLRLGSPESQSMGHLRTELLAVSSTGELALNVRSRPVRTYDQFAGTLARAPYSGGTPRPLGERVTYADWSPDGKNLAVVRETETSEQLEYPLGHVVATTTGHFSWPRVSPSGDQVAFLESKEYLGPGADRVVLVDRAGAKTTLTDPFSKGASGLAWSATGNEIWFTAAPTGRTQELRAVSRSGRQRLLRRDLASIRLLDVSRDGRVLLTTVRNPSRLFFRGESDTNDRELAWLDGPVLMALSSDGRQVLFNEWGEGIGDELGRVYLRETTGAPPTLLGTGSGMAFSPDEQLVVGRVEDRNAVALYPIGAGQPSVVPMVDPFKLFHVAGLLPDARTLVVAGQESASHGLRIWLMNLDGSNRRAISPEGVTVTPQASISPDGTFVLGFSNGIAAGRRVLAYPVAGGEPQPVNGLLGGEAIVGWGPGGECFYTYNALKVYRVNRRTGERSVAHEIVPADRAGRVVARYAIVSGDGKAYAYVTKVLQSDLYLVEGIR